ncbi:hypothetical protein [Mycobacterium sp. 1165178.9]|nr:hypothetical protein [Mycobacterium sp. 1165178.9]
MTRMPSVSTLRHSERIQQSIARPDTLNELRLLADASPADADVPQDV